MASSPSKTFGPGPSGSTVGKRSVPEYSTEVSPKNRNDGSADKSQYDKVASIVLRRKWVEHDKGGPGRPSRQRVYQRVEEAVADP
jgi:hypothetical protein